LLATSNRYLLRKSTFTLTTAALKKSELQKAVFSVGRESNVFMCNLFLLARPIFFLNEFFVEAKKL
jgi:hypothetical protein